MFNEGAMKALSVKVTEKGGEDDLTEMFIRSRKKWFSR